jgi:hypothetical protein
MITTMNLGAVSFGRSRHGRRRDSTLLGSPLRILLGEGDDPVVDDPVVDDPVASDPGSDYDPSDSGGGEPTPAAEKSGLDSLLALGKQGSDLLSKYGGDAKKAYQAAQSMIPGLPNIPGISTSSSGGSSTMPGGVSYYAPSGGISAAAAAKMRAGASYAYTYNKKYGIKAGVLNKGGPLVTPLQIAIGIVAVGAIAFIVL